MKLFNGKRRATAHFTLIHQWSTGECSIHAAWSPSEAWEIAQQRFDSRGGTVHLMRVTPMGVDTELILTDARLVYAGRRNA